MNNEIAARPLETAEEAKARFWDNYLALAGPGADLGWFDRNVEPLLRIYFPVRQKHEPTFMPQLPPRRIIFCDREGFLDYYSGVKVPA